MTIKFAVFLTLTLLSFGIAGQAEAKDKHGRKDGQRYENESVTWDNDRDGKTTIAIGIDGDDRTIISRYLRDNYQRKCPPGLAKKNNGCLPPGQAKKYALGRPVGNFGNLPNDLLNLLSPPRGYRYVKVDTDIVLIGEATKKAIDAVTLLSAVGQ